MSESGTRKMSLRRSRSVGLGLHTAFGFSGGDLTSPAVAAKAGALVDQRFAPGAATELRIHGVSGSDGPTMLEHPHALQVAGERPTAIYRRWAPDGPGELAAPWPVEAYSWGGLTEKPLAAASWILLSPLMLYNVAYFMLPPKGTRTRWHRWAGRITRLLALAATTQLIHGTTILFIGMVGWQNAARTDSPGWWIGWYTRLGVGWRVGIGALAIGVIITGLWYASVRTARRYEARTTAVTSGDEESWQLRKAGFWKGATVVNRQRPLHVGAATATAALGVALLAAPSGWRTPEIVAAAAVLSVAALLTLSRGVDHEYQIDSAAGGSASRSRYRNVAIAGVVVLTVTTALCPWSIDPAASADEIAPGLSEMSVAILVVQTTLLVALAVTVWALRRSDRSATPSGTPTVVASKPRRSSSVPEAGWQPFFGGWATVVFCTLAVLLGGLFSAATTVGGAKLFAQPSGSRLQGAAPKPGNRLLYLPDEAFAFAIGGLAAAAASVLLVLWLWWGYRRARRRFASRQPPGTAREGTREDRVRAWYPNSEAATDTAIDQVARSWAIATITDRFDRFLSLLVATWSVGLVAVEVLSYIARNTAAAPPLDALVSVGVAIAAGLTGVGLTLLRSTYANPARRRTVGALWDVATFWPRATHPLAPPCYAEQAVPELVDRVQRLITGDPPPHPHRTPATMPAPAVPASPVLVTGYSQGAILAPAVVAQLPKCCLEKTALLTLACPLRRLYGRAFPAYFGRDDAVLLNHLLGGSEGVPPDQQQPQTIGRWRNVVRRTDYIGAWIFTPPPLPGGQTHTGSIDVPCLDPPSLQAGAGGTLAPTHYHSAWWQDPITHVYAADLLHGLAGQRGHRRRPSRRRCRRARQRRRS